MSSQMDVRKKCILGDCAHKGGECNSLGECGARYALRMAHRPHGYKVYGRDNPTINALLDAGLIEIDEPFGFIVTARATDQKRNAA